MAILLLVHDLMLGPSWNESEITRAEFESAWLLFLAGGFLAFEICPEGLDRIYSGTCEKDTESIGGKNDGVFTRNC